MEAALLEGLDAELRAGVEIVVGTLQPEQAVKDADWRRKSGEAI